MLRLKSRWTATRFQARHGDEAQYQAVLEGCNDARTGMPFGIPKGAMCVQRLDDSRNSAIHISFRISLRSSSMREPRDPLLKVLVIIRFTRTTLMTEFGRAFGGHGVGRLSPSRDGPWPAKATCCFVDTGEEWGRLDPRLSVMILPQVHLRNRGSTHYRVGPVIS